VIFLAFVSEDLIGGNPAPADSESIETDLGQPHDGGKKGGRGMAQETDESTIVALAIKRDPEAFTKLYELHAARVQRHIYYLVGHAQEAHDLTSETFLRAWKVIDRYEDRGVSISSWLLKIGHNLAAKHLNKRRPHASLDEAGEYPATDRSSNFVEAVCDVDVARNAVLQLPDIQRQVIVWRFIENMSYDEVAQLLGRPSATIRVIQFRALKRLREILEGQAEMTHTLPERLHDKPKLMVSQPG
jgi:RNA polymerase sigma-70 factor (ECF subfamily)